MGCSLAWAMMCDRGTLRPENQDATLMWASGPAVTLPTADTGRDAVSGSAVLSGDAQDHSTRLVVAAVADGMGGPPGGAQASQVIVQTIKAGLPTSPVPDPRAFLNALLEDSNSAVFELAHRHGLVGMGSTCTLLMLQEGQAHLCHVGDSRCYRIRLGAGRLEQWSRDQNVAAELVAQGVLTADEARHHRSSHTLTQAVGLGKPLDPHNMGGIYSRIKPTVAAEKPAGEWQMMDITLVDRHVTVILNGQKIIDNQPILGCTGGALWSDVTRPGPIYFQGDHTSIEYRNIVLKPVVK